MYCTKCGYYIQPSNSFCSNCQTSVKNTAQDSTANNFTHNKYFENSQSKPHKILMELSNKMSFKPRIIMCGKQLKMATANNNCENEIDRKEPSTSFSNKDQRNVSKRRTTRYRRNSNENRGLLLSNAKAYFKCGKGTVIILFLLLGIIGVLLAINIFKINEPANEYVQQTSFEKQSTITEAHNTDISKQPINKSQSSSVNQTANQHPNTIDKETHSEKNIVNDTNQNDIQHSLDVPIAVPNHSKGDTYITEVIRLGDQKPYISTERRIVAIDKDIMNVESMSLLSKKKTVRTLEFTPEWNLISV